MTINEVAPPGFGHTKGDKEKGVKKGGTAAAFDKARKEGRFKGSKSDMFAIMWAMKNKGAKPKYKPGTDKKYKKYQDEGVTYGYKGKKYKKLPDHVKTPSGWGKDARSELGKAKDAITDKLGKTNTKRDGVLAREESTMPNVDVKDRKAIKSRAKNLFKRDLKGEHQGVNEGLRKRRDVTKSKPKAPQFNAAKELVTDAPYMKPALQQREEVASYKKFMADAQAAKDRLKKKIEDRKKKDAQFADYKAKGVRFYDKKGKGRIVKGRKVYD